MKRHDRIDIVFGIDDQYVDPLIVVAYSVLKNNTSFLEVNFHVITSGLSVHNVKKIKQLENLFPGVRFDFTVVDDAPFKEFSLRIKHISPIAYGRFLTAELFPEIDKALYFDADLLVLSDLAELWSVNIHTACVAGSHKAYITTQFPGYKKSIGLEDKDVYINSGVMLMNLKRIRQLGKTDELLRNAKDLKDVVKIQDQDIINITFKDEIALFDKRYNYTDSDRRENPIAKDEVKVIHFNTANKPWDKKFLVDITNKVYFDAYKEYQDEAFAAKV